MATSLYPEALQWANSMVQAPSPGAAQTGNWEIDQNATIGSPGRSLDDVIYGGFAQANSRGQSKENIDKTLAEAAQQAGLPANFDWTPYLAQAAMEHAQKYGGKLYDSGETAGAYPISRALELASSEYQQLAPLAQATGAGSDYWNQLEQVRQKAEKGQRSWRPALPVLAVVAGGLGGVALGGGSAAGGAGGAASAGGSTGIGLTAAEEAAMLGAAGGGGATGTIGGLTGSGLTAAAPTAGANTIGGLTTGAAASGGSSAALGSGITAAAPAQTAMGAGALGSGITAGAASATTGAAMSGGFLGLSTGDWLNLGTQLGGAALQSGAAKDASRDQTAASNAAIAENRRQYDTTRSDLAPWLQQGTAAVGRLGDMLGLTGNTMTSEEIMAQDPGYKFRLDEGNKAITNRLSSMGLRDSGAALKAGTRYSQDYASGEFGNIFNRLSGVAGTGQTAATSLGQTGAQSAQTIGNLTTSAANARGAAGISGANAWGDAFQNIGNWYNSNKMLDRLFANRNPAPTNYGWTS